MTVPDAYAKRRSQYNREAILSATPARLLTMLYDRLLLDLSRAEAAQLASQWGAASENLVHAQAIIAELSASLNTQIWDGAEDLLGIYSYVSSGLVNANIQRDVEATRECIRLLEPLRQGWHEASVQAPAGPAPASLSGGILGVA